MLPGRSILIGQKLVEITKIDIFIYSNDTFLCDFQAILLFFQGMDMPRLVSPPPTRIGSLVMTMWSMMTNQCLVLMKIAETLLMSGKSWNGLKPIQIWMQPGCMLGDSHKIPCFLLTLVTVSLTTL